MANPNTRAFGGLFFLLLVMGSLLLVPAGTLNYWQAWAFLAVFGVSALAITLYLSAASDPCLWTGSFKHQCRLRAVACRSLRQTYLRSPQVPFVAIWTKLSPLLMGGDRELLGG